MRMVSIKNIINEELKSLLKEGYVMEHDNLKFQQKVENSSFLNYQPFSNDYDVDIKESDIIVSWRIGFWLNDMGIENFLVQVDGVQGTYKTELYDKRTDELAQDDDRDITEVPWKFDFDDVILNKGGSLYVQDMVFDFKTKICTVSFI